MVDRNRIAIVDDDESVRESVPDLLRSFGLEVTPFASAEAFLESVQGIAREMVNASSPRSIAPAV